MSYNLNDLQEGYSAPLVMAPSNR